MASEKTPVIAYLWELLEQEGQSRRVVLSDDVVRAIEHCNEHLGTNLSRGNPANFMASIICWVRPRPIA